METKEFTFIDLFAGLGGFHLALEQLGGKCVFASELKEDLRQLYAINFPNVRIEGDITAIAPRDIPAHDVLCGGFPCQPFSKAGKRQGFNDDQNRGNLFYYICDIISFHKPHYVLLENVQNLEGHDNGNTWNTIKDNLEGLGYEVDKSILSPHQFGIPQHRKRIYIACARKDMGGLSHFQYPTPTNEECNIRSIVNEDDIDIIKLTPEKQRVLETWQEFIDLTLSHGDQIPLHPIWTMEFGATYKFEEVAPCYQSVEELIGKKGQMGKIIRGTTLNECLSQLPSYSQSSKTKQFPKWKVGFIRRNREFYERNKSWLKDWIKKLKNFENSHLKMEWNCGYNEGLSLYDKIVQFRPSGVRIKSSSFAPALNLAGTQKPVFPWIQLPDSICGNGVQEKGRYLSVREAAALQGMQKIKFKNDDFCLPVGRCFEALGNAVNVDIVKLVASNLIK